jgi:hypothetical protein
LSYGDAVSLTPGQALKIASTYAQMF